MVAELAAEVDLSGTPEFDFTQRVFCNRELNMGAIEAVGFDMDYTLAQYNVNFDMLAFEGAKRKLVEMGYPEEAVAGFTFDPEQHLRGLVIDKRNGNILKMDRHKYVRRACHGTRELTREERQAAYVGVADATPTFVGDDYVNVDSLFQLVDASLCVRRVADPPTSRGGAAAVDIARGRVAAAPRLWRFRGDESRRRRGCGYSAGTSRGGAAAGTWIVCGDESAATWIFRGEETDE